MVWENSNSGSINYQPALHGIVSMISPVGTPMQPFHWPWIPIVFVCGTGKRMHAESRYFAIVDVQGYIEESDRLIAYQQVS